MENIPISDIRSTLQKFQDGYSARNTALLDDFMRLFSSSDQIELIGVGASKRAANEWFEGHSQIREIVEGDWLYWGNVALDVEGARITVRGDTAWVTTTGTVTQNEALDTTIPFRVEDMKKILDQEDLSDDQKIMEATHYGIRRLRECSMGVGHSWPFTFMAVLVLEDGAWRFHTIHWSMPVD